MLVSDPEAQHPLVIIKQFFTEDRYTFWALYDLNEQFISYLMSVSEIEDQMVNVTFFYPQQQSAYTFTYQVYSFADWSPPYSQVSYVPEVIRLISSPKGSSGALR